MKRYKLVKTEPHEELYNIKDTQNDEILFMGELNERLNYLEEENTILKQQVKNYATIIRNGDAVIKLLNKKNEKLEKLLGLNIISKEKKDGKI